MNNTEGAGENTVGEDSKVEELQPHEEGETKGEGEGGEYELSDTEEEELEIDPDSDPALIPEEHRWKHPASRCRPRKVRCAFALLSARNACSCTCCWRWPAQFQAGRSDSFAKPHDVHVAFHAVP